MRLRFWQLMIIGVCVLLFSVASVALADCSNGQCTVTRARRSVFRWVAHPENANYLGLLRNGVQIGGYNMQAKVYRSYDSSKDVWGPPQRPPWQTSDCSCSPGCGCGEDCRCKFAGPCNDDCRCAGAKKSVEEIPNYGVDLTKLNGKRQEVITLDGKPVSKEEARNILSSGQLVDDSNKLRLTVIGRDAERKKVLDDIEKSPLSDWKNQLLVQDYSPSHWAVSNGGFYTGGSPTIYLQTPDGKVLHRQDDYDDGPDGLATALRRANPNYDPKNDLDLRSWRGLFKLPQIPLPAVLLAVGFLFLFLRRR